MRKVVLAVVLALMADGAQAATLNVVLGQLIGASGVIVDGSSYDVEFLDGNCIALYGGCDQVSDFTFQSSAAALLASQALLDQVLIFDPVSGLDFDADPSLTGGCPFLPTNCYIFTPYEPGQGSGPGALLVTSFATNSYSFPNCCDGIGIDAFPGWTVGLDTAAVGYIVYAVWSPVPEPSTALLVGLGLTGLSWAGRKPSRS